MSAETASRTAAFAAAAALFPLHVLATETQDVPVKAPEAVSAKQPNDIAENPWKLTTRYDREDFYLKSDDIDLHGTARSKLRFTLTPPDSGWNLKAGLNVGNTQLFPGGDRRTRPLDQLTLGYQNGIHSFDIGALPEQTKLPYMDDHYMPPGMRYATLMESFRGLEGAQFRTGFHFGEHWSVIAQGFGGRSIDRRNKTARDALRFMYDQYMPLPEAARKGTIAFIDRSLVEKLLPKLEELRMQGLIEASNLPAKIPSLDKALQTGADVRALLGTFQQIAEGRAPDIAADIGRLVTQIDDMHIRNIYERSQNTDLSPFINQLHSTISRGSIRLADLLKNQVANWSDKDIRNMVAVIGLSNNPDLRVLSTLIYQPGFPNVSLPNQTISLGNAFNQFTCPNVTVPPSIGSRVDLSQISTICDLARAVAPGRAAEIDGYIRDAQNLEFNPLDYNPEINQYLGRLNDHIGSTQALGAMVGLTKYAQSKFNTTILAKMMDYAGELETDSWAYAGQLTIMRQTPRSEFDFSVGGGRTKGSADDAVQTFAGFSTGCSYNFTPDFRAFARAQLTAFRNYRGINFEAIRKNSIYGIGTAYIGGEYSFNSRWAMSATYGQSAELLLGWADHYGLTLSHKRGGLTGNVSLGYIEPRKTVPDLVKRLDWYQPQFTKPTAMVSANIVYNFDISAP